MKITKILIFFFLSLNLFSQNIDKTPNRDKYDLKNIKKHYFDIDGVEISEEIYNKKFRERGVSAWEYIKKDSGYIHRLHEKRYDFFQLDYKKFLNKIEILTKKKLSDSSIILIEYIYRDDLCSSNSTNYYDRAEINKKKVFTNKYREKLNQNFKNILYFVIFEEGINLKNSNTKNEYYYTDKNNELKLSFFKNNSLCGSFMIVNTDSKAFILNGEFNAESMMLFLEPNNWKSIFYED
ncbi:hypothetical protein [Flavobacterium sp.]|uniref:hypothetical protein n=1 Tax=Flavobacterium sp. TaxID=239 RepID=UPI0037BFB736